MTCSPSFHEIYLEDATLALQDLFLQALNLLCCLLHKQRPAKGSLRNAGMWQLQSWEAQLIQGFSINPDSSERISQAFPNP